MSSLLEFKVQSPLECVVQVICYWLRKVFRNNVLLLVSDVTYIESETLVIA